jgi:hypothetical protein
MQHFQAIVKNGRLVLDAPTDLPEGEVVDLVPADALLDDQLDDAELERELEAAADDIKAGRLVDGEAVMARLRARS